MAKLQEAGVARGHITAGFELDLQQQLADWGHVNDARVKRPAGAYVPVARNPKWGAAWYWFWPVTPAVEPEYIVARSELPGYAGAGVGRFE